VSDSVLPSAPSPGPLPNVLWFLVVFAGVYTGLYAFYSAVPDQVLKQMVHFYCIVRPGAQVIQLLAPADGVTAVAGALQSTRASLSVVRGCDGSGVVFLLAAAIVAFPASAKRKLLGLAGALALTYVLNQARLVVLYFVAAYRYDWFHLLHAYFIPMLIIILSCIFFMWWASASARGLFTESRAIT